MKNSLVPFYGSDGSSLGFREFDAAKRLVAAGTVKPAYGRKGHLKAIFEQQEDGGTPVCFCQLHLAHFDALIWPTLGGW